jgi:hypothetical protein
MIISKAQAIELAHALLDAAEEVTVQGPPQHILALENDIFISVSAPGDEFSTGYNTAAIVVE